MAAKNIKGEVIGVELTNDSFRMVHGQRGGAKTRIINLARKQFPADATDDAIDVPYHLASLIGDKKLKKTRIHCTMPCKNMCIRVVSLPAMPYQELYSAVQSKIHKYISVDIEQVHYSFSVIGTGEERGVKKLDVVFAAIEKRVYAKFMQKFEARGIKPHIIMPSCFASWDAFRLSEVSKGAASSMLIDIDTNNTELTVCSENQFVFTRNISIGSNDFYEILKGYADRVTNAPEAIKSLWLEPSATEAGQMKAESQIKERLQSEGEMLRREIELTTNHYYQISHGGKIDKCFIFGQGAQITGLIDFLKKKVGIPVESFQLPPSFVFPKDKEAELKENAAEYVNALGALMCSPEALNLSVSSVAQEQKKRQPLKLPSMNKVSFLVIPLFVTLLVVTFGILKGLNIYYQYQIKYYKNQQETLKERTLQVMQVKKQMDLVSDKKRLYEALSRRFPEFSDFIMEICKAIPDETVVVDELSISNVTPSDWSTGPSAAPVFDFIIRGRVIGRHLTSTQATAFVLALEKNRAFQNISITIEDPRRDNQNLPMGEQDPNSFEESYFMINGNIVTQ